MPYNEKLLQDRSSLARECTTNRGSYCEFLLSDDEGSDFDEDNSSADDVDETYDPASEGNPAFDKKQGDEKWLGRRVVKSFGELGDFEGIVYTIDDDANKIGYRLFFVY